MFQALNAPTLVTWTKSGQVSISDDPSLLPALAAAACLPFTWGDGVPKSDLKYYDKLHLVLRVVAIMLAAFGTVSLYHVSYFICAALVATALHQALAPVKDTPPLQGNSEDDREE